MDKNSQENCAKLLTRITFGGLMLFHGIHKIIHGIGFIKGMLGPLGFLAYGVYLGEVIAPLFILVGFKTRISGLLMSFTMLVAILLAHRHQIFALNPYGAWGIELPMLFLMGGVLLFLQGAGAYSIDKD